MFRLIFFLAAAIAGVPAAAEVAPGKPIVTKPWARASIGSVGAAYVTIRITGKTGDRLVGASSPAAARVEIHTHEMDSRGVARMRKVPEVAIPAGKATVFRPGGLHLMLFGLKAPLKKGGTLPLTLNFARGGGVTVTAKILGFGARGPAPVTGGHKHH